MVGLRREFDRILPWGVLYLIPKLKLVFPYLIKLINLIKNLIRLLIKNKVLLFPNRVCQPLPKKKVQLAALGTDYLDLYMLHSPGDDRGGRSAHPFICPSGLLRP